MDEDEKKREKKNRKKFERKETKRFLDPLVGKMPIRGGGRRKPIVQGHNSSKPEPKPKPKQEKISWNRAEPWTEPSLKSQPKVIKHEVDIEKMLKRLEKHFDEVLLKKLLKAEEDEFKKREAELGIKTELEDADKELGLEPLEADDKSNKQDVNKSEKSEIEKASEEKNLEKSKDKLESNFEMDFEDYVREMGKEHYGFGEDVDADDPEAYIVRITDEERKIMEMGAEHDEIDVPKEIEPQLEDYGAVEIEPEPMELVAKPEIEIEPEVAPENEMVAKKDAEVEQG